jgi:hypothetical protein
MTCRRARDGSILHSSGGGAPASGYDVRTHAALRLVGFICEMFRTWPDSRLTRKVCVVASGAPSQQIAWDPLHE